MNVIFGIIEVAGKYPLKPSLKFAKQFLQRIINFLPILSCFGSHLVDTVHDATDF